MKKNLLALMFVFSVFCVGLFVNEVKASTGVSKGIQSFNAEASKSVRNSEFNKKYAELKEFCRNNRRLSCAQAILIADAAAVAAWVLCGYDPSSCADYQQAALQTLEWAVEICRNSPENAGVNKSIEERKANLTKEVAIILNKKQALAR